MVGVGKSHRGERLGYFNTPNKPFDFPNITFGGKCIICKRLPNIYSFDLDYDKIYIKK